MKQSCFWFSQGAPRRLIVLSWIEQQRVGFVARPQIEDMHNEMEHATGYLKTRLAEQQNKSELSKMQVKTMLKKS